MVTVLARNGTDFGIQAAGTGAPWFTGPAGTVEGLYLGSYGPADANPDIGDSAITETDRAGRLRDGRRPGDRPVRRRHRGRRHAHAPGEMYEITLAENPSYALPVLDFRGAPPAST